MNFRGGPVQCATVQCANQRNHWATFNFVFVLTPPLDQNWLFGTSVQCLQQQKNRCSFIGHELKSILKRNTIAISTCCFLFSLNLQDEQKKKEGYKKKEVIFIFERQSTWSEAYTHYCAIRNELQGTYPKIFEDTARDKYSGTVT